MTSLIYFYPSGQKWSILISFIRDDRIGKSSLKSYHLKGFSYISKREFSYLTGWILPQLALIFLFLPERIPFNERGLFSYAVLPTNGTGFFLI